MEKCRGCNNAKGNKRIGAGVYQCGKCGAVYGTCYLGDSYEYVRPRFSAVEPLPGRERYFDFTTLGSGGIGRRHGWYDPDTRLITQIG
jgi:hypothetical protein